jgi:putative ABC transport system permease protein
MYSWPTVGQEMQMALLQDVRFAVRLLLKQPLFSSVAILTMALAMGVSTALFSVIDAALIRTLPYANPSELVSILIDEGQRNGRSMRFDPSMQDIRGWRALGSVFSHVGSGRVRGFSPLIVDAGSPERLVVANVSEDFLETYGINPMLGRGIHADDTRDGAPGAALLGHAYWRGRFAADPNVLGKVIRVDDVPTTIVGVLPAGFYSETSIWRATQVTPAFASARGSGTPVLGRLKPGISITEATRVLNQNTAAKPNAPAAQVVLASLYDNEARGYRSTLRTLGSAVAVILLIACVNLAGLLLARGFTRQPELAVRTSLGASRSRLVRQMLTESLMLALAGTVLGVLIAWTTLDSLVSLIPFTLPANSPATINLPVLASTFVLCLVTAILFGLVPAISLSRRGSIASVANMHRSASGRLSSRLGQVLVAAEVALALVLLAGAGLLVRSFVRLVSVDLGYDPGRILTMEVEPIEKSATVRNQYYPALVHTLSAIPEVAAVGALDALGLRGGGMFAFLRTETGQSLDGPLRTVLPGYFESLEVRPVMGRLFVEADRARGDAIIINATSAAKYFPDGPLGHTLQMQGKAVRVMRIVGVIPDLRHGEPSRPVQAESYVLPDLTETRALAVVLRPREGMSISHERLIDAANAVGPRVLVGAIKSGVDILDGQVTRPKHRTVLFSLLGGFGLLLTLVGIFGVTVYAVTRRTREIGIRLALGASPRRVVWHVVRDAAIPIVIGIVAGVAGAQAATRVVESFLFQVTLRDPITFVAIIAIVTLAAGLAAWLPARRAAAIEPVIALRSE